MTTKSGPRRELDLFLTADPEALPDAPEISAPGDTRARLSIADDRAALSVAFPDRPRAELRWVLEKLLAGISGLFTIPAARVRADESVSADTVQTIALDLHARTREPVAIEGRERIQSTAARIGALEDLYRDWIDEDPSTRTSIAIGRDVSAWAADHDTVETDVFAEEDLQERGLRLLLAVGQGSRVSPPRLVVARYRPPGATGKPLMLLGKGITFDTGGINVKPYDAFVSMMKNDMGGAALAYALFRGLVEARVDRPLVLVLPTCENAVDGESMRPGSVVRSYRGHDVRIDHTDAEGRLALADGLAWGTDTYDPDQVLCFATLTTAALIAYGPYATPVHFADADFEERLAAASEATGEDLHFFPERLWHREANRDKEADLRNTARLPGNASRGAGSRNAAHFLKHFTDAPLCHLDIFASTWNWAGDAPGGRYGATGAPLRTLIRAFDIG